MLAYRCLQIKWWAAVTVVALPSQKALLMCPYISSSRISVLAPRCFRALLHNLQPTSDRCLIFASHLATGIIGSLQLPSFLAFYVSEERACRSNTSLRTLCFHAPITWSLPCSCHMHGDWYCLALMVLACTHDFKNFFHQSKCSAARISPCFGTMPHIVACVCSPLCHHLHTISHIVTWVCSFVFKHMLASLHVFAAHSLLLLFVLHSSRYCEISNDDLDKLLSLPRSTVFFTWRLLDSSVGTTLCLPSDLK